METARSLTHNAPLRRVPFLNLKSLYQEHREEFRQAIDSILDNTEYISGPSVERFEKAFGAWCGAGLNSVSVGNGTDAITVAAKGLGLLAGAEAILPAMTFIATAEGMMNAGFTVKLVDVEPGTWLMDPVLLKKAISPKTQVVVPVHLYGQMARMDLIQEASQGRTILEDAAQSHGATYQGHGPAYWGKVATFSFYPGKNLGAFGDGGALVSRDKSYLDHCSAYAKHGGLLKYEHNFVGACSRLDGLQAAILSVKLKYIDQWTERRRRVAALYREYLGGIKTITLPRETSGARHVYHLFVIETENRERLQAHLKNYGIDSGIHYPKAIHQLEAFRDKGWGPFPVAERIARHGLSLPMCPTLTEGDIQSVRDCLNRY
ncbi:MAG: DegT/DnrJ/EryC1/StrS family aminotransferase [Deltaproteobacteria bacterium]|nr:DegT/DnrJ/EryC1/StrS family aminotransferase [Deltaproteobacteria bacterium]MBI3293292.1 DegT/DnrJ/EryC1/StrS family aminotransferase [Deltaproteobacteria bacterium]